MLALPPYSNEAPAYTPSLNFYGVALFETEFLTPWKARPETSRPVVLEINTNQLKVYEFVARKHVCATIDALFFQHNFDDGTASKMGGGAVLDTDLFDGDAYGDDNAAAGPGILKKLRLRYNAKRALRRLRGPLPEEIANNGVLLEPTTNTAEYEKFSASHRGKLLYCFTLQNAQIGEAPSTHSECYKEDGSTRYAGTFTPFRHLVRLRVEFMQVLLHVWSFHGMVHWVRNLTIGRDLALLIDVRSLLHLKLIPRHFLIANNALLEASAREALLHLPLKQFAQPVLQSSHRDSVVTLELKSSLLTGTSGTSASSRQSTSSASTADSVASVYSLDDLYSPLEKQYISNCIPTLNLYDKWVGRKITVLNFQLMLTPDSLDVMGRNGRCFIEVDRFNSRASSYVCKPLANYGDLPNTCREFHVENKGLVWLPADASTVLAR